MSALDLLRAPTCCLCGATEHLVKLDGGWLCPGDVARYLAERARALREASAA